MITGNSSNGAGGGLWDCDGAIRNNMITDNLAGGNGGGLFWCSGTMENNVVASNSAEGGGGGLAFCSGTIRNNTISSNRAEGSGGGLNSCDGPIQNNTICGNSVGSYGGALAECHGTIQNCIIWGNTTPTGPGVFNSSSPTYSCIQGWTGGGEGNTTGDPQFIDPDGTDNDPQTYEDNDYRLSPGSSCIDAGTNQSWMEQAVDLDGNPRVFHGGSSLTVDMGAYEYGFFAFKVTELSKDPSRKTRLTWNSLPGETYIVWWRYDMLTGVWALGPTIDSGGETTTWTDFDTISPDKFYRIELE